MKYVRQILFFACITNNMHILKASQDQAHYQTAKDNDSNSQRILTPQKLHESTCELLKKEADLLEDENYILEGILHILHRDETPQKQNQENQEYDDESSQSDSSFDTPRTHESESSLSETNSLASGEISSQYLDDSCSESSDNASHEEEERYAQPATEISNGEHTEYKNNEAHPVEIYAPDSMYTETEIRPEDLENLTIYELSERIHIVKEDIQDLVELEREAQNLYEESCESQLYTGNELNDILEYKQNLLEDRIAARKELIRMHEAYNEKYAEENKSDVYDDESPYTLEDNQAYKKAMYENLSSAAQTTINSINNLFTRQKTEQELQLQRDEFLLSQENFKEYTHDCKKLLAEKKAQRKHWFYTSLTVEEKAHILSHRYEIQKALEIKENKQNKSHIQQ